MVIYEIIVFIKKLLEKLRLRHVSVYLSYSKQKTPIHTQMCKTVVSESNKTDVCLYKNVMNYYFNVPFICLSADFTTLKWIHHLRVKRSP